MRRRTLARAVISIIAGFAITVAISTAISLRVLPRGTPTTRVTFDWDHPFTSGWLMHVDHTGAGWTRRAASLVAPNTYGVAGHGNGTSITLAITPPGDGDPR